MATKMFNIGISVSAKQFHQLRYSYTAIVNGQQIETNFIGELARKAANRLGWYNKETESTIRLEDITIKKLDMPTEGGMLRLEHCKYALYNKVTEAIEVLHVIRKERTDNEIKAILIASWAEGIMSAAKRDKEQLGKIIIEESEEPLTF
jgi:hypothetical protein